MTNTVLNKWSFKKIKTIIPCHSVYNIIYIYKILITKWFILLKKYWILSVNMRMPGFRSWWFIQLCKDCGIFKMSRLECYFGQYEGGKQTVLLNMWIKSDPWSNSNQHGRVSLSFPPYPTLHYFLKRVRVQFFSGSTGFYSASMKKAASLKPVKMSTFFCVRKLGKVSSGLWLLCEDNL